MGKPIIQTSIKYKYKYANTKYDLGYEGAVLHETGKTDHHQSSREQSSRLSLHAAGAVDRRPDVFWLEIDPLKKSSLHLEKEPVVGMEEKKEPMMLHAPRAIISWLASRGFPPARRQEVIIFFHQENLC